LTIYRDDKVFEASVQSGDRDTFMVKPSFH